MVLDSAANFVRETTTESVDSTQTSIGVSDSSAFVDPSASGETDYNVVIWDADNNPRPDQDSSVEIMRVTAIDTGTDTLTVTRGEEGTSGASHPNGAAVAMMPTAGNLYDATLVDDTDSPYVTQGEDRIYADESAGAVTIRLATADTIAGKKVEIVNLTGTNTVTVDTEGAETIDPNGDTSKTITHAGKSHAFTAKDGSTWHAGFPKSDPVQLGDGTTVETNSTDTIGIGVGIGSIDDNDNAVFIGNNLGTPSSGRHETVLIGEGAGVVFGRNVVIGRDAVGRNTSVVVGHDAQGNGADTVAIGDNATVAEFNDDSIVVGADSSVTVSNAIHIANGGSTDTSGVTRIGESQLVFSGTRDTIADADLNNGELTVELDETNNAFRLRGKDSGGTVREATVAW